MKIIRIEKTAIQKFMKTWPCSGLDNINHIIACIDHDASLIDLEAYADEKETTLINYDDYEGSGAMSVLLQEAFENCKKGPFQIDPTWRSVRVPNTILASFFYE